MKHIPPQALHEFLTNPRGLKGKNDFVRSITGQDSIKELDRLKEGVRVKLPLVSHRYWSEVKGEIESRALGEIRTLKWKNETGAAIGMKVVEVPAGAGPLYYPKEGQLGLDIEAGLALQIMVHYMPSVCRQAQPVLKALLQGNDIPKSEPAAAAGAFFMLHLANRGLEGMFEDLFLTDNTVRELVHVNYFGSSVQVQDELRDIQFNYIYYVYEGSRANVI